MGQHKPLNFTPNPRAIADEPKSKKILSPKSPYNRKTPKYLFKKNRSTEDERQMSKESLNSTKGKANCI